ncbi:xanthine dehydrogenase family protein molybdopterin-binding subunit [Haloarchaeobius sp. HRN-SO-5]|uniref:xanthine dehydrogenase family protein molybdopterin-binding subunit n=1 Tax=Haloarchaeobius sp. HRN-SO-5 TaxID=3446118 RepID=UPI003EC06E9E
MSEQSRGHIGEARARREDLELVTGHGSFVDDMKRPGMAFASFVRSEYAHARIEDIDTEKATAQDDVLAVYTADDLAHLPADIPQIYRVPTLTETRYPLLAEEKVRYQGMPVAVVVAEDRYAAHHAADLVEVEYERLDPVLDPVTASDDDAPTIHEDRPDNVAFTFDIGDEEAVEEAFDEAAQTVSFEYENQRIVPNPIEPRAVLADYDPYTDELDVVVPSQQPFLHKTIISTVLDHPKRKVRVEAPNIGGGFGAKSMVYPDEAVTAFCAKQVERPVKWVETRSEAFQATEHGRGQVIEAAVAVDDDGQIIGLDVASTADVGGELGSKGCLHPSTTFGLLLSGQYDIPAINFDSTAMYTNRVPIGVYRGVGRAEAICTLERLVHLTARELGEDPVEFRRRHFVAPDQFPYETAVGSVYDSGQYERALEKAIEMADYEGLRERQASLREEDRYLGIGISCFIESGGLAPSSLSELFGMGQPDAAVKSSYWESSIVRVHGSGEVTAYVGTSSPGTGVETTHSQIVADKLGVDVEDVDLIEGRDTAGNPDGSGSVGSRSAPVGGGAMKFSIDKVIRKAEKIAAHKLEADPEDVEFEDGEFHIAGAPEHSLTLQAVAQEAEVATDLPEDLEPGLEATSYYDPENFTWAFGTHIAVVEVDEETGEVDLRDFYAVDDCGVQINPQIVEGQIQGGIAQGIGQARYEGAAYDENANLISGSLQDYTVPKAGFLPDLTLDTTETPSPHNPLGVKGVAESGTIGATPAVANAIVDALEPFGVEHIEMPMTDERVWQAMHGNEGGR